MLDVGVVREVEPRDVHAGVDHRLDRVEAVAGRTDRRDQLGLSDIARAHRSDPLPGERPGPSVSQPAGRGHPAGAITPRGRLSLRAVQQSAPWRPDDPPCDVVERGRRRGARRLRGGWSVERRARDRPADRDARARLRRGCVDRAGCSRPPWARSSVSPGSRPRSRRAARRSSSATPCSASRRASRASSDRARTSAAVRATASSAASFGALRGFLLALMVVYVAMWFDALRATGAGAVLPEIGDSIAADVTSGVVESAIETAVDTSQPAGPLRRARRRRGPRSRRPSSRRSSTIRTSRSCATTREFWNDIEHGNVDAATQRRSFLGARRTTRQLRHRLAQLGLVADEAAIDAEVFRQSVARGARADRAATARAARRSRDAGAARRSRRSSRWSQNGDTLGLLRTRASARW